MRHRTVLGVPRRVVAALAATSLALAAGCGTQSGAEPTPDVATTEATTTTSTPATLETVSYKGQLEAAKAEGKLPWFCRSGGVGGAMDHGHLDAADGSGLANQAYTGQTKGELSAEDCTALAGMFDEVITKVKPFRTRGEAKKLGGFVQSVQFVPGLGTHDIVRGQPGGFSTGIGEPPAAPMFLQFDGDSDDAPLAGLSWLTMSPDGPPEGFPGDNDWWHTHVTLCYSGPGTVIGNEISDEECKKLGGANRALPNVWMAHAWIIPGYENLFDVFSGAYMCLKGDGKPPAADDPCRDDRTDPEHQGHGGGHGAGHGAGHGDAGGGAPAGQQPGGPMPGMDHGEHAHTPGMDHSKP